MEIKPMTSEESWVKYLVECELLPSPTSKDVCSDHHGFQNSQLSDKRPWPFFLWAFHACTKDQIIIQLVMSILCSQWLSLQMLFSLLLSDFFYTTDSHIFAFLPLLLLFGFILCHIAVRLPFSPLTSPSARRVLFQLAIAGCSLR